MLVLFFMVNNLFSYYHTAAGLMGGENEHFGYLHMFGGVGGIDGHIGDIVAREGFDALIELGCALGVAVEADVAEIGLYEAGLEVGDADGSVGHVDAESVGEGLHGCLCGTVDIASCVSSIARHTTYINNVSAVALDHLGHDEACHGQQAFDVGVDHGLPVVEVAFVFGFESQGEAGIIDEHVDLLPLLGQSFDGLAGCLAVSDVEGEHDDLGAFSLELLTDGLEFLHVTAIEDEAVAIVGEFTGATEADAAGGACDENGLVHIFMLCHFYFVAAKVQKKVKSEK